MNFPLEPPESASTRPRRLFTGVVVLFVCDDVVAVGFVVVDFVVILGVVVFSGVLVVSGGGGVILFCGVGGFVERVSAVRSGVVSNDGVVVHTSFLQSHPPSFRSKPRRCSNWSLALLTTPLRMLLKMHLKTPASIIELLRRRRLLINSILAARRHFLR